MIAAYVVIPLFTLYFIYRALLGKLKARTAIFFTIAPALVFSLCFVGGAAVSFMYEPQAYWTSMSLDFPAIEHTTPLGYIAFAPYELAWMVLRAAVYILVTHFTWAFAGFYSAGVYIVWNWILATVSAKRIRNPDFGFGSETELAQFRRILKV